jgi:hypothetical protein
MRRTVLLVAVVAACLVMASGVALAVDRVGTNGPDTLRGTDGEDNLLGLGGNDELLGLGGSDNLVGGPGKDIVFGGNERRPGGGDKNLVAGAATTLVGAAEVRQRSGRGRQRLFDRRQLARILARQPFAAAPANDVIVVDNVPAFRDVVACGGGFDRVLADREDTVARDCERVKIVRGSREEVLAQEHAFFESIPESSSQGSRNRT